MKLLDLKPQPFRALFVGESGCGKSVAGATHPGNLQFLDFDGRIQGVQKSFLPPEDLSRIDVEQFTIDSNGFTAYNNWANKVKSSFAVTKKLPFDMVQIDSASSFLDTIFVVATELIGGGEQIKNDKGQVIMNLMGPKDYKAEVASMRTMLANIRALPVSFIMTCHTIDRWVRPEGKPFGDMVVDGYKLTVREKIAAPLLGMFDDVFYFSRGTSGGVDKWYVEFSNSSVAKNIYGIPSGKHDITNWRFWDYFQLIQQFPKAKTSEIWAKAGKELVKGKVL